jgi:hypothetical protein
MNSLFEPSQTINAGDKDVLNTAGLEVGHDTQREVGPFGAIAKPVAEHSALPI